MVTLKETVIILFCLFFPTYSIRYLDKNTSALIMLSASTRWLGLRGDALSNLLVTSVSAGALFATQSPGESTLNLIVSF